MGSMRRLVGFVLAAITLIEGCGGSSAPPKEPAELLRNYAFALRSGDAKAAWNMLGDAAKRETSFMAFSQWLKTNPADARRLADELEQIGGPVVTATIPLGENDRVEFVEQAGTYKIIVSSLDEYPQLTPNQALKSFVLAVKRRRYDILLRLSPERERKELTEQRLKVAFEGAERDRIMALASHIELALPNSKPEVLGTRGTLNLGAGQQVTLVLEAGAWTIEDYVPIIR